MDKEHAPAGDGPAAKPATVDRADTFRTQIEPEIEVLLRVGRTLTGSWPDADDLVQETLIRAWRAVDRFDGAHPRAWLLTILRHTHLNMVRRTRPELIGDTAPREEYRPAFGTGNQSSPEDQVMEQSFSADLERAVAGLDPRYRTVLLLVDVDQLSYAEAAEVLDIPLGTVVSRLSRARDKMRRKLRPGLLDEGTRP